MNPLQTIALLLLWALPLSQAYVVRGSQARDNEDDRNLGKKARTMKGKQGKKNGKKGDSLTIVKISIQPAFHGLPIYIAMEKGWFEDFGIDVDLSVWTSGGPQVMDAVENDGWDIGIAGIVPNIIAGPQGISTVAISNDESLANAVLGAPGVTEFPPTSGSPTFAFTDSSTGELVLRECLGVHGITLDDSNSVTGSQEEVISFLETTPGSYGALWAPNSYTYQDKNPNGQLLCSGAAVGETVLGGVMIRDEWAEQNTDVALLALSIWLRAVSFVKNASERQSVLDYSEDFYDFVHVSISRDNAERDILTRPIFGLDEQLLFLGRNQFNSMTSAADKAYESIANFLLGQGVIDNPIAADSFVTDEYLMVNSENAALRSIAYGGALY